MKEFKTGISDINEGVVEGVVLGTPNIVDTDGKETVNFVINSCRYTSTGVKYFQYNLVIFDPYARCVREFITDGKFVRCNYHLMSVDSLCKPVVDYIQIDD